MFLFAFVPKAFSEDWYISNAAGMILEKTFSRAALREPYALKIEHYPPNHIPADFSGYIDSAVDIPQSFGVELHTLYENAEEKNRRWILKYLNGNSWLVISVRETGNSGFAEYYDESGFLIQEDAFTEGSILSIRYSYNEEILLQSETWQILKNKSEEISAAGDSVLSEETELEASAESLETKTHLWNDIYHYSRAGSLRSIERLFFSDAEEDETRIVRFLPLGSEYENLSTANRALVLSSDFLSDIINLADANIESVTDEKGRIISETYKDAEGNIIGELINIWSGDRLVSISWNGENDKRLVEYEYDERGNRMIERNYRDGVLERLVRTEEDREVEELYLQGSLSLRAVWKDGQKISEEYFRNNPRRRP